MSKDDKKKTEPTQDGSDDDRSPCCACCCKPEDEKRPGPEYLVDGKLFENRSCTDCCMILIYAFFLIGWIVLISLAAEYGKPDRILKPENYRGELCGEGRLGNYPTFFVPLPSRPSYGFCTNNCPSVGDIVCNNDIEANFSNSNLLVANQEYNTDVSTFASNLAAYTKCSASCNFAEQQSADRYVILQAKMKQRKCFTVFYPSAPSLLRCIPGKGSGTVNVTLQSLANESAGTLTSLADTFGVGSFFTLGFAEVEQTWRVILISAFTCMGVAVIWVLLLRWILAPIVYFVILLILGVLIGLGFVFRYLADEVAAGSLPGEEGAENQEYLWRAGQWIAFILAGIYFGVMLHMLQRIRIAIAVMKEASKAFMASPSMIFVPIFTLFILLGWVAFFIVTSIYIQTIGKDANEAFAQGTRSLIGTAVNVSKLIEDLPNSGLDASAANQNASSQVNMSYFETIPELKYLHAYNFFGVLWTGNICLLFGFMTMAMTVTSWYFSASQHEMRNADADDEEQKEAGKEKHTIPFVVPKAAWATFANHLGTVMWGALLIAIIQFIRAVFTYIAENYLKNAKENVTVKILLRCAQCCLWYIEQVIKIISKNAFIITAIRNTNFCVSAYSALKMLLSNAARLVILTMLSTATIFLIKLFVVGINFFIAFGLMKVQGLTDDRAVDSGLFPLFLILIMSFVIASLFMNVYEACIDTIFLCFLVDEEDYNAEFMPESLAQIVDLFKGAEEARLQYEKTVQNAMTKAEIAEAKK